MSDKKSHPDQQAARPLAVLRAMIDAVDREVLQQLARRNSLVEEIAGYKRAHGLNIRDFDRERELLDDRRTKARALGLAPELVESVFRLVLWGSRDRQAALRAELPPDVEPRTVAIIGGRGGMGQCIEALFAELGHAVMIADLDTRLSPAEAAATADVVVISVPIDATADVIAQLGPLVRDDALLMDVTSTKAEPVRQMLEATNASVVGTHPLFGPSVHSLQGQRVVLCRGRGDAWFDWVARMFHARGLTIMETAPEEHDRAMSVVQVLTHFSTEVMGRALVDLGVSIQSTVEFSSPVYLMELLMTARHFAQSPELYASIAMSNPETATVTKAFADAADALREQITGGRREEFIKDFKAVKDYFGAFAKEALEQSSFLIDRLVERT